ncbi:MAG: hypothetical protein LBD74_07460 [Spirochaetaceae bacterium]|jgi:hypothetical protein|nr:hypothetical protein [Spirochaetaceae bacterium]
MKKNLYCPFVFVLTLAVLTGVGCVSSPKRGPGVQKDLPDFVMNPPTQEDALFGIGTARLSTVNQSMQMADARARQALAFQLNTNVQAMITDYARDAGTAQSQAHLELAEIVGRQLTQVTLSGATVIKRVQTNDGSFWTLMSYSKADAARAAADIIDNEASRYAEFKTMEALKMMDQQLDRLNTKPEVVDQ